jgi:cytochrome c-type biogenesis protein
MIEAVFIKLSHAVEGAPAIALIASFLWGILSIILSPCHLASIPLIVGFVDEQGRISAKRAFSISLLFGLGILITIAVIGAVTAALGRMMGDIGRWGNYFVAVIFFLVGLHLIGLIPMPWAGANASGYKRKGLLAAFVLGLIFGIALGPCTFAYMAPMLAVAFRTASTNPLYGAGLLLAYGIGHCSVLVLAGTFTEVIQHYLNWSEKSKGTAIVKIICGSLVILGGVYMIFTAR